VLLIRAAVGATDPVQTGQERDGDEKHDAHEPAHSPLFTGAKAIDNNLDGETGFRPTDDYPANRCNAASQPLATANHGASACARSNAASGLVAQAGRPAGLPQHVVRQEIGRVDVDGPAGDVDCLVHAMRIDQVGRPDGRANVLIRQALEDETRGTPNASEGGARSGTRK